MAPHKAQSTKKKCSFLFTAVAATCCGVIITIAFYSLVPNREPEIKPKDVQMLHEKSVGRHMDKIRQGVRNEPLPKPMRPYRPKGSQDTDGIYGTDSPYSKPDPSAVYANLVQQAKPYRKEMIQKLRDQADHPEDDNVEERITHQAIDYIEKNGLYFQ